MPLFYQQNINETTKLGIWKIEEPEDFFLQKIVLQQSITHLHKRLQHMAGRYLLQFLFPDFPNSEILIADTRKPYLASEQYHFSISHCTNYAAAIASKNKRVGIDIEIANKRIEKIREKFLSAPESGFIEEVNPQIIEQLTIAWGAKEAIFKWWSYGNIDFKKHIRLQPFTVTSEKINALLLTANEIFPLKLHFKLFEELCLVWVLQ
ncbi:MAG: 4'-phosphopantetheinyl transferase family protein [Chitinophagaceae bacterium]